MVVSGLVAASTVGAGIAVGFAASAIDAALSDHLGRLLAFLAAAVVLQFLSFRLPGRGSVGVSAVALVGAAIALGTGPAIAIAVVAALAQWVRVGGLAHRALFDAANFALSAGASGLVFHAIVGPDSRGSIRLAGALVAGLAYTLANHGLLCAVMAASEGRALLAVWRERFHWARFHFLAFGALALLAATADAELGAVGLVVFVVPPLLLALSLRSSFERMRGVPA